MGCFVGFLVGFSVGFSEGEEVGKGVVGVGAPVAGGGVGPPVVGTERIVRAAVGWFVPLLLLSGTAGGGEFCSGVGEFVAGPGGAGTGTGSTAGAGSGAGAGFVSG